MEYEINTRRKNTCSNCGRVGHEFRNCIEPITSYGIINIYINDENNESVIFKDKFCTKKETLFKISSRKYPDVNCFISDNNNKLSNDADSIFRLDNETIPYYCRDDIHKFSYYKNKIYFMMVSRRFSLGFIEFIRGKYDVSDVKTIVNLFEQMYQEEIKYIRKNKHHYDNILYHFLNRNGESKDEVLNKIYEGKYSNEYCEAKFKFNMLLNPSDDDNSDIPLDLNFYTKYIKPRWRKPEWGFPKGRREKKSEENLVCACREFEEETGYKKSEYSVLNKIEPIEEKLIGTNGVNYKHIYYLAINNCDVNCNLSDYDAYEIGDIKWFTYDEAISHIRPYHVEKKRILTKVYLFILNYLIHNIHNI
ncbi:putative diphosphoinositol polyphosphate phosphohydrolase [Cotonvirus japonicus]|uniref:Diphosphoinositol polyphosphate phosphohydrolase n=1 Tax=Cotonvirus japonicus TaxID=2811091 RepID=A0ABM7NSN3_9VIRU|nr:putative diphosphoinositol polyphosphate phosphohydrolase [Cotonvirus japonicus]BCS83180.1 putative diphosphoinositol polyphosphate phosphohydrolase [Cotonvirus japonicus]